jgi:hypothetical protein
VGQEEESSVTLFCLGPGHSKIAFVYREEFQEFPEHERWSHAKWDYDAASGTLDPDSLSTKRHECGYTCHMIVKANDYIFTA